MIYNERCTIVAKPDKSIKTVFVDQIEVAGSGREYNAGQKTIGDVELEQFLGDVLAKAIAENEQLRTERDELLRVLSTVFDSNVIRSEAFFDRIPKDRLLALAMVAATDATAQAILELLNSFKVNAWQVVLDAPELLQSLGYLVAIKVLTEEQADALRLPATKEEAWVAPS
jgi:hypothetical protein